MDDSELIRILSENSDLFSTANNVFLYMLRFIGWWIIRGLCWLVSAVETAVNTLLEHLDFFSATGVGLTDQRSGLFKTFLPIFWALMIIGVMIVGYLIMTNRLKKKADIPLNLVLTVLVVLGMPTILSSLTTVVSGANDAFMGNESLVSSVIRENVYDHVYLDENGLSGDAITQRNNLPAGGKPETIIDPVELAKDGEMSNKKLYQHRIVYLSDGSVKLEKFASDSIFGDLFSSYYYRYKIQWFSIFLSLFALLIALTFTAVKTASMIWNIAYNGIIMMFIAPLDISSGQRTKAVLHEIINLFATFICIMYSFKLYTIGMGWAADTFSGLTMIFCQLGFSFAMIKGPDIVQKILGINAGVGSELQQAASMMYMGSALGRATGSMARGVAKMAQGVGKAAGAATIGGAAGAGALSSGIKNAFGSRKGSGAATEGNATQLNSNPNYSGKDLPEKGADAKGKGSLTPYSGGGGGGSGSPINTDAHEQSSGGGADSGGASSESFDAPASGDGGATFDSPIASAMGSDSQDGNGTYQTGYGGGIHSGSSTHAESPTSTNRFGITEDDTIGSSIRKMTASTHPSRPEQHVKNMQTAFRVGSNTMDKRWDGYRNSTPHIHAEPVPDSPKEARRSSSPAPDIIIDDAPRGKERGNGRGISNGNGIQKR